MCIVGQGLSLSGVGIGRIMHQCPFAVLLAERFKERARHIMKFYQRHMLFAGHHPHGIGIVAVGLHNLAILETTTLRGGHKHDMATLSPHHVYILLEIESKVVPCARTGTALLLVVMTKLTKHVVAFLHHGQYLLQPVGSQERSCRQTALGMVRDGHSVAKPSRYHLSPTGPRFPVLVYHGGVSAQKHGNCRRVTLYLDGSHGGCRTIKFQRETVVPVEVVFLAVLDLHRHLV